VKKLELGHPLPSGAWWREALANYSTAEIEDFLRAEIAEDLKRNLHELAEGPCDETNPQAVARAYVDLESEGVLAKARVAGFYAR
jgi:hypothetical protein